MQQKNVMTVAALLPETARSTVAPPGLASGAGSLRDDSALSRAVQLALDGTDPSPRTDRLRPFQRLVVGVRWGTLLASVILLLSSASQPTSRESFWFVVLAAWTAVRTVRPVRHWGNELGTAASVVLELGIAAAAVCTTGCWDSPLAFMLLPGVVIGGFSQGGPLVVGYGTITGLIVTLSSALGDTDLTVDQWQRSGQWTIELMVIALVAGVGHRVLHDTLARHSDALNTMDRLTTANSLLFSLHRVAQSLPASLDLDDVLISTIANARDLFPNEAITILLTDDRAAGWSVARAEGVRLTPQIALAAAPPPIGVASASPGPIALADLAADLRIGLLDGAQSGIYAPLRARGTLVGVLAIEHTTPSLDTDAAKELAKRFSEPASVAIDNARWFGRIRAVSADEERVRIARDLHDRIGQSLAYLGFELDRITRQTEDDTIKTQLISLRTDVRKVVTEVRETLYDIRTDVSKEDGVVPTLSNFLDRVRDRTTLAVSFEHDVTGTLPVRQEREMWQIAQEAVINVERHAHASTLAVRWRCDGRHALLEVSDDGRGFAASAGRVDSYGMRGLHERANAIGARMEILTQPGQGTTVRCRLESS